MTDRTDPNGYLPAHVRGAHCVEGVCSFVDAPLTLLDLVEQVDA